MRMMTYLSLLCVSCTCASEAEPASRPAVPATLERTPVQTRTDPAGPAQGRQKVVRGGSWHRTATSWRSSFGKPCPPDYRGISIGFRIAMTVDSAGGPARSGRAVRRATPVATASLGTTATRRTGV